VIGNLSRRERAIVVGAIVLGALVGGWLYVVEPIRERNASTAELVPMRDEMLARRKELVARRAAIEADLQAVDRRIESLSARLLTAAAPAVAASELQNIAKEMATAAKTETRSERILPPVERGELLEIGVEIAVSGEIGQLVDLLTRVEASPKLLRVQDLKVRVMNITQPKDLLATMVISGFIRPAKAKA
jgi:type II secretory pathway component PulM